MQGDVSGLQLAFVVKHHGVDPRDGVVLHHTEENNIVLGGRMKATVCFFLNKKEMANSFSPLSPLCGWSGTC